MLVNGLESAGGYPKNAEKMLKNICAIFNACQCMLENACIHFVMLKIVFEQPEMFSWLRNGFSEMFRSSWDGDGNLLTILDAFSLPWHLGTELSNILL